MNAHLQYHRPCGQRWGRHNVFECPNPDGDWYDHRTGPDTLRELAAVAAGHTTLNTALWWTALCIICAVAAHLIGIVR